MAGRFGRFDPGADPEGMAELLMSSCSRLVAQHALSGAPTCRPTSGPFKARSVLQLAVVAPRSERVVA